MMSGLRLAPVLLLTGLAYAQAPQLESIGPIAFGPDNTLLVSDPVGATIYAFDVSHVSGDGIAMSESVEDIGSKVAAMLGTSARDVQIVDVAVNPGSGQVFMSLTRGTGPDATPLVMSVSKGGKIAEVSLANAEFSKAALPNAPESREGRRGNPRMESITDMAYVDGKVVVAGLSNEEFASKLRALPYPFKDVDEGASVEIWHAAHGAFETRSPVRTFVSYEIDNVEHLLAAYTCTPLVAFPITDLEPGKKVMGKTIAELGNRNRPLDMIVYERSGSDFLLLANNSRGVMKIAMDGVAEASALTETVSGGGTDGIAYETIEALDGVMHLDKLSSSHAVILVQSESGALTLKAIPLP